MIYHWFLLSLLLATSAHALDEINLNVGEIESEGWKLKGAVLTARDLSLDKPEISLKIQEIKLATLKQPLKNLTLSCNRLEYQPDKISCAQGNLQTDNNLLEKSDSILIVNYDLKQKNLNVELKQVTLAQGKIQAKITTTPTHWQADIAIQKLVLDALVKKIQHFTDKVPDFKPQGKLTATTQISGNVGLEQIVLKGDIEKLGFESNSGMQAAQQLDLLFNATLQPLKNTWKMNGSLGLKQGEMLFDPVYVTFTKPASAEFELVWSPEFLDISHLAYHHSDILNFEGYSEVNLGKNFKIKELFIRFDKTSLPSLYEIYLKNWLQTSYNLELITSGALEAEFGWDGQNTMLSSQLHDVSLENSQKSFGWQGIHGTIQWHNQDEDLQTELRWTGGYLGKVKLGKSAIKLDSSGDTIKLLTPIEQPILDGALRIEKFLLQHPGKAEMSWELLPSFRQISMKSITQTFDLPALKGKFTSHLPLFRYHNQLLQAEGKVLIQAFDGDIVLNDLKIENLLGKSPILKTNVDIQKINLKTLTSVTNFGEIQGQLSGKINQLRLNNWQPVSFDAYFATPEDNTLPRKISQKAVNSLSNLGGGGVVNALSQGILSFFEDFSYEKINWGCHLENKICRLRQMEPATEGYYIVKGRGLPRIDVIGYNEEFSWDTLLNRLKTLAKTGKPVIK